MQALSRFSWWRLFHPRGQRAFVSTLGPVTTMGIATITRDMATITHGIVTATIHDTATATIHGATLTTRADVLGVVGIESWAM